MKILYICFLSYSYYKETGILNINTLKILRSRLFKFILIFPILLAVYLFLNFALKEKNVVEKNGQLRVENTQIVNIAGEPIALQGMSLFWSQWGGKYYNADCIKWLRDDWNCQIIRVALATGKDGYAGFPEREMEKVKQVIDAGIDLGLYVLVDWHSHHAEEELDLAIGFFEKIAHMYGEYPNVIYEIYNEPERSSWSGEVKPYANKVIAAIRCIDPDNIIVVGSPHWAQDVDIVAKDPLIGSNIAYSLHFYAGTHKQWLRDKAIIAMDEGLALWVTEFGTCKSDGDGEIDYPEMEKWFEFMEEHSIGWCNWSIGNKDETSAALIPDADSAGGWKESMLTESGNYIRKKLRKELPVSE